MLMSTKKAVFLSVRFLLLILCCVMVAQQDVKS